MKSIRENIATIAHASECLKWRVLRRLNKSFVVNPEINYIVEKKNWSIYWDGSYITKNINDSHPGIAAITTEPAKPDNTVVHFGSQYMWQAWNSVLPKSNKYVVTFFHGKRSDEIGVSNHIDRFLDSVPKLSKIVTAASIIENRLLQWGVPREKVVRIPIGVDTSLFTPPSVELKNSIRNKLGIPENFVIVGSFQKDGNGWGEGLRPKLIKGPDIFIDSIVKLNKEFPVFVVLTGPARGYVKKGLEKHNIPYIHHFLQNYLDLVPYYQVLDLYLVTSREEGGPKSIPESMATGVPVVSTKVGMAEDMIFDGETGCLVDIEDVEMIVKRSADLLSNKDKINEIVLSALNVVNDYDWKNIAKLHYEKIYISLLR